MGTSLQPPSSPEPGYTNLRLLDPTHPRNLALMRRQFFTFACFVCFVGTLLPGAETEFVRVWPSWRDAESFERIGEYFGGAENTGRELVVRTQPAERTGYYFLVRVKHATATPGARFALSVMRPDTPEPKEYSFPVTLPAKESVFQLGLTGADWPEGKKAHPVAWKIALIGSDGRVLAEHKSFLWEKPAK